jgi:hypothetical protein
LGDCAVKRASGMVGSGLGRIGWVACSLSRGRRSRGTLAETLAVVVRLRRQQLKSPGARGPSCRSRPTTVLAHDLSRALNRCHAGDRRRPVPEAVRDVPQPCGATIVPTGRIAPHQRFAPVSAQLSQASRAASCCSAACSSVYAESSPGEPLAASYSAARRSRSSRAARSLSTALGSLLFFSIGPSRSPRCRSARRRGDDLASENPSMTIAAPARTSHPRRGDAQLACPAVGALGWR